jgi:hypothetical protein
MFINFIHERALHVCELEGLGLHTSLMFPKSNDEGAETNTIKMSIGENCFQCQESFTLVYCVIALGFITAEDLNKST